jgi:hypothetical protein
MPGSRPRRRPDRHDPSCPEAAALPSPPRHRRDCSLFVKRGSAGDVETAAGSLLHPKEPLLGAPADRERPMVHRACLGLVLVSRSSPLGRASHQAGLTGRPAPRLREELRLWVGVFRWRSSIGTEARASDRLFSFAESDGGATMQKPARSGRTGWHRKKPAPSAEECSGAARARGAWHQQRV